MGPGKFPVQAETISVCCGAEALPGFAGSTEDNGLSLVELQHTRRVLSKELKHSYVKTSTITINVQACAQDVPRLDVLQYTRSTMLPSYMQMEIHDTKM